MKAIVLVHCQYQGMCLFLHVRWIYGQNVYTVASDSACIQIYYFPGILGQGQRQDVSTKTIDIKKQKKKTRKKNTTQFQILFSLQK